ncbi:hypothetical protein, partial [Mycoplasmopsis bovis]|uniref:hypothetical protein n=1 Tax=Mycoplasmopsis bovis TaxID=28903 RepID=UPI003D294CFC
GKEGIDTYYFNNDRIPYVSVKQAFSKTAGVKSSATTTPLILLLSLKWSAHPAGSHSSLFSKIYFFKR